MRRPSPKPKSSFRISVILALALFLSYIALVSLIGTVQDWASRFNQPAAIRILNDLVVQKNDTRVLVLLYNTAEARIGGGFSGSLTVIEKNHGKLHINPVQSVYYFDDLGVAKFDADSKAGRTPPVAEPYIRDTNQSIEWSTNAKIAADRYEYATGQHIDTVIGLSQEVLQNLLAYTGPVTLADYHKTLSADNFLEQVELEVESGTDKQNNAEPKSILGEVATAVIDKLWQKNILQLVALYPRIADMATQKQFVLWSRDPTEQQHIEQANLAGKITPGQFDYLFLAEQNTSANKSTPYIQQQVTKHLTIDEQGKAVVNVTISRTHTSGYKGEFYNPWGKFNMWLIGENRSLMKLVLPPKSQVNQMSSSLDMNANLEGPLEYYSFVSDLQPLGKAEYQFSYELPFRYDMGSELDVISEIQKQVGAQPYNFKLEVQVPPQYHLSSASTDQLEYKRSGDNLVVAHILDIDSDKIISLKYTKAQ